MKRIIAFSVALVLALITGCDLPRETGKKAEQLNAITIMTWNVQTLFDGVEDGTEYDEFLASAGWTREKYAGRLNVITKTISGMEKKPDIIAMQEVESVQVMNDLAAALSTALKTQGYSWTHFANIPGMPLGVGLISRFPMNGAKAHAVYIDGDITPRPMLEVRIDTDKSGDSSTSLALFVCHWKSKLGGVDVTESIRRASAGIILRRIRELAQSDPLLPVIVTGDLNENHDEFYRRSGTAISALLPDDVRSAELVNLFSIDEDDPHIAALLIELQKDFIIISKNKPPETQFFPAGAVTLYSPWAAGLEDGTYYYRNNWETIDHFLLSWQLFEGTGWAFENCAVVNSPPFANTNRRPIPYNPRTGSGLSDHLPLLLFLKFEQ